MLSSFGAQQVDLASSAEDALTKCRYDFYDVILCDYNLGIGKNGQQILEELRIRKRLKHTHLFIMITAETAKDVVLGAREYQPDAYIAKPITRTVLEQRLGQLLIQQCSLKAINKEIDLENYPKAITLCHQKLEEKTKYQSWCMQTLAKLYIKVGDLANASSIYKAALASRELPWARIGLAHVLNLEHKHQEARQCFEQVIRSNPNLVEAYDGMSETCLRLGLAQEAQLALTQATALSPRMVPRQEKLGGLCLQNNDIENAANAFRMAVQYAENSVHDKPDHYLNLGRCLSEWSEGDLSETGKLRAKEALAALFKLTADRGSRAFWTRSAGQGKRHTAQSRKPAGRGKPT
jgi:CheY-like chemotaxis protein